MITTILIVLVAVVVLIVIIAVLALHFLRADDSDTFDEISAEPRRTQHAPADPPRQQVPAADRRRQRHPESAREPSGRELSGRDQWAEGAVRVADDRTISYRDRDTGPRPAVPERRSAQAGGQRPIAASARPGKPAKPAKPAGPDSNTSSWDSLSDVDYWAELAADKPQVGPPAPPPGSARPNGSTRRGPDAKSAARIPADARAAQRGDSGPLPASPLPVRSRPQSSRNAPGPSAGRPAEPGQTEQLDVRAARASGYGNEPATQSLAALARLSGQQAPSAPPSAPRPANGQRPGTGQRPAPSPRPAASQRPGPGQRSAQPPMPSVPAAQSSQPNGYSRTRVPLDDDPLTSPSFPAINTSDSRSYRTRRPSGAHSGPHASPQPANGRTGGGLTEPAGQYPHVPAPAPMPQAPPVANPYGSYVSAPQPPQPAYQDVAASHPDAASYGNGYTNGQQDHGSWYGGTANGYLPSTGYADGDPAVSGYTGADPAGSGYPANGYHSAVAGGNGYGAGDYQDVSYQGAGYQAAPPAPNGYGPQGHFAGQFDQRGYSAPDPAYGQDGYQGYPGYGAGGR